MTEQEQHARSLADELARRFVDIFPPTSIEVEGAGVDWRCIARRGAAWCRTSCLDDRGPEFLTEFSCAGRLAHPSAADPVEPLAHARHNALLEMADAIGDWLADGDLPLLYERYPFVDRSKRALADFRDEVYAILSSQRSGLSGQLERISLSDQYSLTFARRNRRCEVLFRRRLAMPESNWSWEEDPVFTFLVHDVPTFVAVLSEWILHQATPSRMRHEFPWLSLRGFENEDDIGTDIESEFSESWNAIEGFYDRMYGELQPPNPAFLASVTLMQSFIRHLRAQGYDQQLRAGQSMFTFVVSRSRRHGMQTWQPSIAFEFHGGGRMTVRFRNRFVDADDEISDQPIAWSPAIGLWLDELAYLPID